MSDTLCLRAANSSVEMGGLFFFFHFKLDIRLVDLHVHIVLGELERLSFDVQVMKPKPEEGTE